jgi:UDP-N-acetylmuramate dehydrogenase
MSTFSGLEHIVRTSEPLAPYTWLRLGGAAQYFAEPTTTEELVALVQRCHKSGTPVRILGGGSNLIVRDEGVQGLVISLAAAHFGRIERRGDTIIAGAGAKLSHLISAAVREGLKGLEELAAIPGTVGGALRGNVQAHSGDIGQAVVSATMLKTSGEMVKKAGDQLHFAHHYSNLDELVILEAEFGLEAGDPVFLTKQMQQHWIQHKAAQPLTEERCARLFKNPTGSTANQVIDDSGLRGYRVKEAVLSSRNSNFVVVSDSCRSKDVLALVDDVQKTVRQRLGIDLEPTVECW